MGSGMSNQCELVGKHLECCVSSVEGVVGFGTGLLVGEIW